MSDLAATNCGCGCDTNNTACGCGCGSNSNILWILILLCCCGGHSGCGKYLLKQIIKIAKKDGQKSIRLDVLSSNKPAICLYEKCSFLLQGHQIMDYGKPVIASLYEKII